MPGKMTPKMNDTYIYRLPDADFTVSEDCDGKVCVGNGYNFVFNKHNGNFARWGINEEDDPSFSPIGPEILDLEVSSGKCHGNCPFCYKENSPQKEAENMSFEQFKTIIDKFPKTLTQIAFGITDLQSNPDFFKMMEYARSIGVIPNFTTNGINLNRNIAENIIKLCGAIAISAYPHMKNICYDAIDLINTQSRKTKLLVRRKKK